MFSPCPGFPVPMVGAWRSNDYYMNWLGWHGAEFGRESPPDNDEPDPSDEPELEPPSVADPEKKPDPVVNQPLRM